MTFPKEQGVITLHSAAGADANGPTIYCDGLASVGVQVGGTVTNATIYWEGTIDGTNWVGILGWNRNSGVKALTATAAGLFAINVTGLYAFRARLDWTSGSINVYAKGSSIPITTLVTAS